MWLRNAGISVVAGMVTPFALLILHNVFDGWRGLMDSFALRVTFAASSILLVLGVSLWRPIIPWIYGGIVAAIFPALIWMMIGWPTHSGSLAPLAYFVAVVLGAPVAVLGTLLRHVHLPAWAPAALIAIGVLISLSTQTYTRWRWIVDAREIVERLQEIRQAEIAHASGRGRGAFTCHGPDLPGMKGLVWRSNQALGLREMSQAFLNSYWVYLECEASASPKSFKIRARRGDDEIVLDSAGRVTRSRN
jgi:hypothetical protein